MILLALSLACTPDQTFFSEPDVEPPADGYGIISGRVCNPSGYTWVEGAKVYINVADETGRFFDVLEVLSDADGYWSLEDVPEGYGIWVYVQKGDEVIEVHQVDVFADQETRLEEPDCFDPAVLDVAVITGDYDAFDQVLDAVGVSTYRLIDGLYGDEMLDFLLDLDSMREYDVIFFNGGHVEDGIIYDTQDSQNAIPNQVKANLLNYVQSGGSIYASDWAYYFIEVAVADAIDFYDDDATVGAAMVGDIGDLQAQVIDPYMQILLGGGTADIGFELNNWVVPVGVDPDVEVLLQADAGLWQSSTTVTNSPIAAYYEPIPDQGVIIYTAFHNETQITVDMRLLLMEIILSL